MVRSPVAVLVAAAMLAGCADDAAVQETEPEPPGPSGSLAAKDFERNEQVRVGVAEGALVPVSAFDECEAPYSACFDYPFEVTLQGNRSGSVTPLIGIFTMEWGNEDNDFDLYVLDADGDVVVSDEGGAPNDGLALFTELSEGTYTVHVLSYMVVDDEFTLEAMFISLAGDGMVFAVAVAPG